MSEPKEVQNYLDILRREGHNGPKKYSRFMRYLERKAREENFPLCGQFELTPLCNLNCRMCYVRLSKEQLQGETLLTTAQWKDVISQAYAAGMFEASLTGGECLAYPGFDELYLLLWELGCPTTVMSNGVLLDEKRLAFFKERPPALLQITLYGCSEDVYERVTGSRVFRRVYDNLRRVKDAGLPLAVTITPSRTLGEDVFETIRLADSLSNTVLLNADLFVPDGEDWRGGAREQPDPEYSVRVRRFHMEQAGLELREMPLEDLPPAGGGGRECAQCGLLCGGGRSSFIVDWRGNLRICNRMPPKEPLLELGFEEAWKRLNRAANAWPQVAECAGCPYENVCDRCAAQLRQFAEPGQRPVEHCERTRYLVSRGVLPASECQLK